MIIKSLMDLMQMLKAEKGDEIIIDGKVYLFHQYNLGRSDYIDVKDGNMVLSLPIEHCRVNKDGVLHKIAERS